MLRDIKQFAAARRTGALSALGYGQAAIQRIERANAYELGRLDREAASARRFGKDYTQRLRDNWRGLGASVRAANCLSSEAFSSLEEVRVFETEFPGLLMRVPNCGRLTLKEIRALVGLSTERTSRAKARAEQRLKRLLAEFTTEQLLVEIERRRD